MQTCCLLLVLCCLVVVTLAFHRTSSPGRAQLITGQPNRHLLSSFQTTSRIMKFHSPVPQMFKFGGGGASSSNTNSAKKVSGPFVITVDGKKITVGDDPTDKILNLRKQLMKNNIDVYPLRAKLTGNCGGAGICGTCAVKVIDGMSNISTPSKNEENTLKGKPADYRLACAARLSGPVTIKTKP